MGREIKFRAKRIDNGQWVYGQYFKTPLTDENSGTSSEVGWFFLYGEPRHCIVQDGVSFVIDVETLCQYTGLKDKNGKNEVFEGDIVDINDAIYEVKFDCGGFMAGKMFLDDYWNLYGYMFKVIGNIHQNPELLEGDGS